MAWYWWLILGVLIGWVLGWLVEILWWRGRRRRGYEARIRRLEGSLDECHRGVAHLRGELERRELQIASLERGASGRMPASAAATVDSKRRFPDVGVMAPTMVPPPVAAPKAGAQAPEVEAAEIAGEPQELAAARLSVEIDAPDLGVMAPTMAALAVEVNGTEVELPLADVPQVSGRVDDLTHVRGIGPKVAATLNAAGIVSFEQIAEMDEEQLGNIVQAPIWRALDYGDWVLQSQMLRALPPAPPQAGDDLTTIEGIGPKYAERLNDGGVNSFARLATSNEAKLKAMIAAPEWRRVDYSMWIEQARLIMAGEQEALLELQERLHSRAGDNLALIRGVGPKAKAALADAGITSFAALAASDEAQLSGIIEGAGSRAGDYAAWRAEAKLRAAGKRVSHST